MNIENRIAQTIFIRMRESGGLYIHPDFVKDRFVHFAIYIIDFLEYISDGRKTLHGTVMAAYQKCDDDDVTSCLKMSRNDTALDIPASLYKLKTFTTKAKHKPKSPTLSVKLPNEFVTNDLCCSIVEYLVWVMFYPIEAMFNANYHQILKPMKLFPDTNITA